MNPSHIENLAEMLDQKRGFIRPATQQTGFTLNGGSGGGETRGATTEPQPNPSSLPMPSTVVDVQLGLPQPSHSQKAKQQKEEAERQYLPHGTEIWSQAELERIYLRDKKKGFVLLSQSETKGEDEVPSVPPAEAVEPTHTVLLEQTVGSEDVYLGLDPLRSSEESSAVVVKVELPKVESLSQISLRVEEYHLFLRASIYYLDAALPRRVDGKKVKAQWDSEKRLLHVRLAILEDSAS